MSSYQNDLLWVV